MRAHRGSCAAPSPRLAAALLLCLPLIAAHAQEAAPAAPAVHEIDLRETTPSREPAASAPETIVAEQKPAAEHDPCRAALSPDEAMLDRTSRRVERMVCASSLWFDGLFGEPEYANRKHHVYGDIEISHSWSEYYGHKPRIRFDARFDLPNLDRRFSGFIGRDNEDDFITDRFDNSALRARFPQVNDNDEWLAGLGYSLPSRRHFRANFRIGVRGLAAPQAFAQFRTGYNAYSDDRNLVFFRMTPFWTTRDGFGVTIGGDYSHVLSDTRLLRWRNVGTRSEATDGLAWRSSLTYYQALPFLGSGIAPELFIRGVTGAEVELREYGFQTTFRHPLARRRLFVDWVAGYSFPREQHDEPREGSLLAAIGVEMPFGLRDQDH